LQEALRVKKKRARKIIGGAMKKIKSVLQKELNTL